MQAYKILENLIPQSMAESIERTMLHTLFAYNPSTINDLDWDQNDSNVKPTHQFIHPILHADGTPEDNLFDFCYEPNRKIVEFCKKNKILN